MIESLHYIPETQYCKSTVPKKKSSHCGSVIMNPTNIHEDEGSIPGLAQWVKGSTAVSWEFPYATSMALKRN